MDDQFDVELQDGGAETEGHVQLPMNFLSFGEIENDDVKVYIHQHVYKELEKYASSDTTKELGTILVGDYGEALGKPYVIISDFIEAKYTDASASTLTFTHETWDYVHKQHDSRLPDKKIVGWQHTHPNYGIFLSNYDLFIQENFFNLPFQIAYVIDPIQNLRGFFQWKNGRIEKLKGFYIYDDVGKPIKIAQKRDKEKSAGTAQKSGKSLRIILALLCVTVLALAVFSISINEKYKAQIQMQKAILARMEEQDGVIENQKKTIEDLQKQLENGMLDENGAVTVSELMEKIESQGKALEEFRSFIDQEKSEESNAVLFKAYTVAAGDTLDKICADHGIDYYSSSRIILSINGIENPNQIHIGQTILLPIAPN